MEGRKGGMEEGRKGGRHEGREGESKEEREGGRKQGRMDEMSDLLQVTQSGSNFS